MRNEALSAGKSSSEFDELRLARTLDLACECMDTTCTERVTLTVAEYEATRADSNPFVVVSGHEVSAVEEIVGQEEHYLLVSRLASEAAVAEKLDP